MDAVVEESVTNRFKRDENGSPIKCVEPVICFLDGWRFIPNLGIRKVLVEFLGADTDAWIGRRLIVSRHLMPKGGRWEKRVTVAEDVPGWVHDDEQVDTDDPSGARDDERSIVAAPFGRRGQGARH